MSRARTSQILKGSNGGNGSGTSSYGTSSNGTSSVGGIFDNIDWSKFCPLYKNFKTVAYSIFPLLFVMFAFPTVVILIFLSVNNYIGKIATALNIIGILIFYAIILYSIYLIIAAYLNSVGEELIGLGVLADSVCKTS